MIRKANPCDTEGIMHLWLEGNLEAHAFVPGDYWRDNAPLVREQLLSAEVYVYEQDGEIHGFAGMQGSCLAGIFVERKYRSAGVGKRLLDHIKERYPAFTLYVYQRNLRALAFYRREGLSVTGQSVDADTGEQDFVMNWGGPEKL